MPRVTAITIAYNMEGYIASTIESMLSQSWSDFEYIIVDDGSTDRTLDIARSYEKRDARIKIITKPNGGIASARNAGVHLAQGEYVAFLDADDHWHPQFLERMIGCMDAEPAECMGAFCWSQNMADSGELLNSSVTPREGRWDAAQMLAGICPPSNASSLLVRKAPLIHAGLFNTAIQGEDSECWVRMATKHPHAFFYCLPEKLIFYRVRRNSHFRMTSQQVDFRIKSIRYRVEHYLPLFTPEQQWNILISFAVMAAVGGKAYKELAYDYLYKANRLCGVSRLWKQRRLKALLLNYAGIDIFLVLKRVKNTAKKYLKR